MVDKFCCKRFEQEYIHNASFIKYDEEDGNGWWTNISYEDDDFQINFCPFCGKKLEK